MDFAYTNRICGVGDSKDGEKKGQKLIVDFTIAIFFDGTCNNKYNFQYARDAHKDFDKDDYGSYHGSFTNVAQMWFLYDASGEYTKKIYVEGRGTAKPIEVKEKNRYKDEDDFMSSGKRIVTWRRLQALENWASMQKSNEDVNKLRRRYTACFKKTSSLL